MDLAGRTLLSKYRIERQLGQGGMGTVWKGSHVVTGRQVAIKVLDERFLSNVNVVQRFGREARAASAIQHDGIVEVLDLDQTEEGLPFLVMEFLDGETLARRIERKTRLGQEELLRIADALLDALEAAHAGGVVHRDLKPENIYLVPAGRRGEVVKILDFGISSKDDEAAAKLTMTGSVLGTPHYMSPEQAMGEVQLDRRVDIYAVGVVLYECAVGEVPFDAPNYNRLLRLILDEQPAPPTKRGALLEPAVEAVILHAMAKSRDDRPQTAQALRAELVSAARGVAVPRAEGTDPRASMSFGRPREGRSVSSGSFPRTRSPSSEQVALGPPSVVDSEPEGDAAKGWMVAGLAAPTADSKRSVPRRPRPLEPPSTASLGALSDFDAPTSGPIELDDAAIKKPPSTPPAARSTPGEVVSPTARRPTPVRGTPQQTDRRVKAEPIESFDQPDEAPPRPPSAWERLSPQQRRYILIAVALFAAFVAVVAAIRTIVRPGESTLDDSADASDPSTEPPPDAPPDTPVSPEWVSVDIDGIPPGARLRLDGIPGAQPPLRLRRGTHHVVEITAPGYVDRRLEIDATSSRRVRAEMRPQVGTGQLGTTPPP